MKKILWLLMLLPLFMPAPSCAQSIPPCSGYDRWSVGAAATALAGASATALPPDCFGTNWSDCRSIANNFLDVANDHLAQVFNGEVTYGGRDCLQCNMNYMVELAENLSAWSKWLTANGYRNDYHLAHSLLQGWQDAPYCANLVEICDDGWDNDRDGLTDDDDPDCPFTGGSVAAGRRPSSNLYIWTNDTVYPSIIGVAEGTWSSGDDDWKWLAGPFADHPEAWREACRYHTQPGYHAPDIEDEWIDCKELGVDDPSTSGAGSVAGWTVNLGSVKNRGNTIETSPPGDGATSYYLAPARLEGSWANQGALCFDLKSWGGTYYTPTDSGAYGDVVIKSGSETAWYNITVSHNGNWQTHCIPLDSSSWVTKGSGRMGNILA